MVNAELGLEIMDIMVEMYWVWLILLGAGILFVGMLSGGMMTGYVTYKIVIRVLDIHYGGIDNRRNRIRTGDLDDAMAGRRKEQ